MGAARVIHRDFQQALLKFRESVEVKFQHQRLKWHFIPPSAPHMGGLWEAAVKSFKHHFKRSVENSKLTFEELCTLLCRIEACLNSRPLSPQSESPNDIVALTPGHFLVGDNLIAPCEPEITEKPESIVNRWRKLTALYQHLCQRWKSEYLRELHKRYKWKTPERELQYGDMVVVKEDDFCHRMSGGWVE